MPATPEDDGTAGAGCDVATDQVPRVPEEWRAITVKQLRSVRKDIIRNCPAHVIVSGLNCVGSSFHNHARVTQESSGATGYVIECDTEDGFLHVQLERGRLEVGQPLAVTGKEVGSPSSVEWAADNWISVKDRQSPLLHSDVNLYDLNHYMLCPWTVPGGVIMLGVHVLHANFKAIVYQEATRATGKVQSVEDGGVHVSVLQGRFVLHKPVSIDGKAAGSPTGFRWAGSVKHCSFVELLASKPQRPRLFTSHWWGEPCVDFIACVEQHSALHGFNADTPYWVCAYANDQHELSTALGTDPRDSSFFRAISDESCHGVLLILNRALSDDIPPGVPFTRIWCAFEQFIALTSEHAAKLTFDIGTCDKDGPKLLLHGLTSHEMKDENWVPGRGYATKRTREDAFPLEVLKTGLTVELQKAQASNPDDRRRILSLISKQKNLDDEPPLDHVEYHRVNAALRSLLCCSIWPSALGKEGQVEDLRLVDILAKDEGRSTLDMAFTGLQSMTDVALAALADAFPPRLEFLMLGFVSTAVGDPGVDSLCAILGDRGLNLRSLRLDLRHTRVGDAGVQTLAKMLGQLPLLDDVKLDLSYTQLTDCGMLELAQSLERCAGLRRIPSANSDAAALTPVALRRAPSVVKQRSLDFNFGNTAVSDEGIEDFAKSVQSMIGVSQLSLCFFETVVSDKGVMCLAKSLDSLRQLLRLNLVFSFTRIGDASLTSLANVLPALQLDDLSLSFRNCDIAAGEGLGSLARAIRSLRDLRRIKLNFRDCKGVGDEAAMLVADAIESLTCLQQVNVILIGTAVGDSGASRLTEVVRGLPTLQQVQLGLPKKSPNPPSPS
eukprot:TRINITY_DN61332_c0_g1_i1.p1 TRINITY_DN61332_c0_g1~~TRINITY_DN61332_c0_g1_i1.p1  ORF type:complete len:849 (+),score=135.50 TRINITY_DN61332_c0_g1_i1:41-2548(+)